MTPQEEAKQMYDKYGYEKSIQLIQQLFDTEMALGFGWDTGLYYMAVHNFKRAEYYILVNEALLELDRQNIFDVSDMD